MNTLEGCLQAAGTRGETRATAAKWFLDHGLPHPKEEAWRFTSLRALARVPYAPSQSASAPLGDLASFARTDGAWVATIVNGRVALPSEAAPEGVTIEPLASAFAERELGTIAGHGGVFGAHAFGALNAALFPDALVLRVKRGARIARPIAIAIASVADGEPAMTLPRVLVVLEPESRLELVEVHGARGSAEQLVVPVAEVALGEGAELEHARVAFGGERARAIGLCAVRQARGSRYASRVATFGGRLTRLELSVRLEGEGAETTLDGLYVAGGDDQVDHLTTIDHATPHGTSHEKYKGIVSERARAVFDGTILVRPGAVRTVGHQENRNLVFSDEALVHTKPHLEIDCDDVQCGHGATVGQVDEDALFYLRARGVGERPARALLALGFAREMIERVPLRELRERLGPELRARLPGGELLREAS
jgi:Fe-S cluster assembly protein SufD